MEPGVASIGTTRRGTARVKSREQIVLFAPTVRGRTLRLWRQFQLALTRRL